MVYVRDAEHRWGLNGNGSESSAHKALISLEKTIKNHYFRGDILSLPGGNNSGSTDYASGTQITVKRGNFKPSGQSLDGISLIVDTELIHYKWVSVNGNYPDYEKLLPTEFSTFAHFDTVEVIEAVNSLKALSNSKGYPAKRGWEMPVLRLVSARYFLYWESATCSPFTIPLSKLSVTR